MNDRVVKELDSKFDVVKPKSLVDRVLESGLVDRSTAQLMENWGYLPEGSVDKVNEDKLKNATHAELTKLTETLAEAVETEHALRETYLDLERLKWPVHIKKIVSPESETPLMTDGVALIDRMGRYYFRIQDVQKEWFVPGFIMTRQNSDEKILQSQVLYVGDQGVCIQVTTDKSA